MSPEEIDEAVERVTAEHIGARPLSAEGARGFARQVAERMFPDGSYVRRAATWAEQERAALDAVALHAATFRDEARAYTDSAAWVALDTALEKLRAVRS